MGWGHWLLETPEDKRLKLWTHGFQRVISPDAQTPRFPEMTSWVHLRLCRACSRRAESMVTPGTSLAEMVSEAGLQRGARRMLIGSSCSFAGTGPGPDSLKRGECGPLGLGERCGMDFSAGYGSVLRDQVPPGQGVVTKSRASCLGKGL